MANAFILFGLLIAAVFVVARLIRRAMRGKLTTEIVITSNSAEEKLAVLSKEVTQLKKTNPKAAVDAQKVLIRFAKEEGVGSLSNELRLAYLLHLSGQKDEAFGYLEQLVLEGSQLEKISSSPKTQNYWWFRWQVAEQRGKLLKTEKKWDYWLWNLFEEDEARTRWALCVRDERNLRQSNLTLQVFDQALASAVKNYEDAFKKLAISEHLPELIRLREKLHKEQSWDLVDSIEEVTKKFLTAR